MDGKKNSVLVETSNKVSISLFPFFIEGIQARELKSERGIEKPISKTNKLLECLTLLIK